MKKRIFMLAALAAGLVLCLAACGENNREPITITLWHVYGGEVNSPMNTLVDEFNRTVGQEQGIRVRVDSVSNSGVIHENVLAAAYKDPGAPALPDLFVSYPKTVLALPDENILADYHDYFTDEELDSYLPEFIEEGTVDDRLGILPLAKELGLDKKGGCVLAYNGGKIVDCVTGEALYQVQLGAEFVPELCEFAARQDVAILTYNSEGIVCERDQDVWANKECFTTKLPMLHVDDLASYVDYPICKMLITLDPARRDAVCAAGKEQFAGRIDLYPSSPFFIEAVPLGVAKDRSLAALLERMGLTRENLMACGDGLNDRSMISYAGVGVAMQNAEDAVKTVADYVTAADNNHDGVAEAIEKFILN